MSKKKPESRTHIEQNLTQETDTEKQLLELVEQTIDELADEKYHYSLDMIELEIHSVRLGVYGVENYDLPPRNTVAKAVAQQFNWTSAFEKLESTDNYYSLCVVDWD